MAKGQATAERFSSTALMHTAYRPRAGATVSPPRLLDTVGRRTVIRLLVSSNAFSPDGKIVACGDESNTVSLWDFATGKELHRLRPALPSGTKGMVRALAFSPDDKRLAVSTDTFAYETTLLSLWEVATGKEIRSLPVRENPLCTLAFSPDGKFLAFGRYKGVSVWDTTTDNDVRQLKRLEDRVYLEFLTFAADGKTLLAAVMESLTVASHYLCRNLSPMFW
jgi:WD40 repeat protein